MLFVVLLEVLFADSSLFVVLVLELEEEFELWYDTPVSHVLV